MKHLTNIQLSQKTRNLQKLNAKIIISNGIASLFFGSMLWYVWSSGIHVKRTMYVPVCFYNTSENSEITAPEQITITLQAPRAVLATINKDTLAIHIDAQKLKAGKNPLYIGTDNLFLPETIKLVHYNPANSVIQVNHKDHIKST